jgi:hypothetical protein
MTEAIEDLQQAVEDTVRLRDGEVELLTGTPGLPVVQRKREVGQCSPQAFSYADQEHRSSSYSGISSEPVTAKLPVACSAAEGCAPPIITEYSPG